MVTWNYESAEKRSYNSICSSLKTAIEQPVHLSFSETSLAYLETNLLPDTAGYDHVTYWEHISWNMQLALESDSITTLRFHAQVQGNAMNMHHGNLKLFARCWSRLYLGYRCDIDCQCSSYVFFCSFPTWNCSIVKFAEFEAFTYSVYLCILVYCLIAYFDY